MFEREEKKNEKIGGKKLSGVYGTESNFLSLFDDPKMLICAELLRRWRVCG